MKKTILIIDDFETTLYTVGMTLETIGYDVIKAGNAQDALKCLDGSPIHLIITDLNMPNMNGIELTKAVRKNPEYQGLPILMLSTENSPEKKKEAMTAGITGWVKKPYQLEEFQKVVKRLCK